MKLLYEIDLALAQSRFGELSPSITEAAAGKLQARLREAAPECSVQVNAGNLVEISLPKASPSVVKEIKRIVADSEPVEFAVLANHQQHVDLILLADSAESQVAELYENGQLVGKWRPSAIGPDSEPKVTPRNDDFTREIEDAGKPITEFLIAINPDQSSRISSRHFLRFKRKDVDGQTFLSFQLNEQGAQNLRELTSRYQRMIGSKHSTRLAILVNGELQAAPVINYVIGSDGVLASRDSDSLDEMIAIFDKSKSLLPLKSPPIQDIGTEGTSSSKANSAVK